MYSIYCQDIDVWIMNIPCLNGYIMIIIFLFLLSLPVLMTELLSATSILILVMLMSGHLNVEFVTEWLILWDMGFLLHWTP